LQQHTRFKFYIDAWYLIVTQAENTPSTATVDINITQHEPTLKLVTQFEIKAKHSKRRSDQVFKIFFTSLHISSLVRNMKSIANAGKRRSRFRAWARCNAQFATASSSSISTSNLTNDTVYRRVVNSCLF